MWHSVPRPGETPQAAFLRQHIFPRFLWLILGIACWGLTVLIACGVWAIHNNALMYKEHPTPAAPPTVVERVIRFEQQKTIGSKIYIGTLDGELITERDLMYAGNTEKIHRDTERDLFRIQHGYGRHPCDLPDGCYERDQASELAIEAIALIAACVDVAALGLAIWLLWGAIIGREIKDS